jgi:hypothetical protein
MVKIKKINVPARKAVKKEEIILHPDRRMLEIDGVFYREKRVTLKKIGQTTHVDKVFFKRVDKDDQDFKMRQIVSKIKDSIPQVRIAEEVVKKMNVDEVERVHNLIFKKKAKIRRQDGCLGIEIGSKKKTAYIEVYP